MEKKKVVRGVRRKSKRSGKNQKKDFGKKKGPSLPSQMHKEIKLLKPNPRQTEDASDSDEIGDFGFDNIYEYDEPIPQEESKKNHRFDDVDNLEYELPDEFEDENVSSSNDDDDDDDDARKDVNASVERIEFEDEDNDDDNDRHMKMLQGITGMPSKLFEAKKKDSTVDSLPNFEYNLDLGTSDGKDRISIHDLLDPLYEKPGFSMLRKGISRLERHSAPVLAPLPKVDRDKIERKSTYEYSKKNMKKWEPLVKRNRESRTIYFDDDAESHDFSVDDIVANFKPRTKLEKEMADALDHPAIIEARKYDGAKILELNKVSVEDEKERQNRLAKMRSLLFSNEIKAKRIRKIKSKTFHRLLKKDMLKTAASEVHMDPEAAKEYAMKQEFKRAEERMTLKHKNSSKWAKRILKRGLNAQDDGTRSAIAEQLNQHALLTRKMNSVKDNSSSDESSDDDRDDVSEDGEDTSKLLMRAKEKTLKVVEEDDEIPEKGVFALGFMVRAMKKRKVSASEEAYNALQDYDLSMKQQENMNEAKQSLFSGGKRVFGVTKKQSEEFPNKLNADSDEEFEPRVNDPGNEERLPLLNNVEVDFRPLLKESGISKQSDAEPCNCIGSKSISRVLEPQQDLDELFEKDASESEEEMVDGMLSSSVKDYQLPSQADLIQSAFAGDDVEGEFEKDKLEILKEENPEPEKPVILPGWGDWTDVQQKKGMPRWMAEEHEKARKKREDGLKKRKDAKLSHVIISEKVDKKAEKFYAASLPFPFTSKEVYEQSMRMPLGPDFNPATSIGALNRPKVVKKAGTIIKPIKLST